MKLPSKRHISEFFSRAVLFGALFIALSLSNARAAELVMFEQAGCAWCEAFDREIAPIYGMTEEGLRAPLRRVDTAQRLPADLAFIETERLTPLFVLSTAAAKSAASVVIPARITSGVCSAC